jgi:hypothetical protein
MCATLHDVPDVFNVEELWHRARRSRQGEFLMEALTRHPRTRPGRHRKETCFHHVIVRIPRNDYVRDLRLNAGSDRQALANDLVEAHIRKLGAYVPDGEAVRYRIEADPALPEGQVRFLFGPAVYLPGDGERPAYRLGRSIAEEFRELGIVYPGQRLTLLNGDPYASTFPVPDWPFSPGKSVLLIVEPNQAPTVCAEPDGSLTVQSEDGGLFRIGDSQAAVLTLRIEPLPGRDADRRVEAPTWTPGGKPTRSEPRLRVVGIALRRLSLHAQDGLRGWRLGFDRHGALVGSQAPNAVAWLRIDAADQLWGETAGDSTLLSPPTVWRSPAGVALELGIAPEPMSEYYCGWVRLPQPAPLLAPVGRWFCFGRGAEAELNPGLLDDPDALLWNEAREVRPEQLMLSRRHLNLRLDENGWTVQLESQTWPAYRLDPSGESVQVLSVEDHGREWIIEPGAWLVVGGYLLELG